MEAPVAMSIRAFCQAYSVGRSLAYRLIADGNLVARTGYEPAPRIVKMRARLKD